MKKNLLIILIGATTFLTGAAFITKNAGGKAGQTGSPSEGDCGACHNGGISAFSGATISVAPSFTSNTYVPGNTYTVTIAVGALSFTSFGFACEVLNASNTDAGTIQNPGAGVQIVTAGNARKNATHTAPKSGSGFTTFTFQWVAPTTGAVTIYAAGNCVNGNSTFTGDLPVKTSLALISPTTATGMSENTSDIVGFNFYPNPVKDNIHFIYTLKETADVSIELVGINGQLIANLIHEKQNSGLQTRTVFMPSSVASGVYFLRTNINGKQYSQKLITIQ